MTTQQLISLTFTQSLVIDDDSASHEDRQRAAFAFDKNMNELERRASKGDTLAATHLAFVNYEEQKAAAAEFAPVEGDGELTQAARKMWA